MQTWVESQVRKKARNVLILCLTTFGITGFLLYLNADYWRVFLHGPPEGNAEALSRDAVASTAYQGLPDPYLTIRGEAIENTGAYFTKSEILKTTTTRYYLLKTQDKILIIEDAKKNPPGTTVSGSLSGLSEDLKNRLFPDGTDAALVNKTYPLVLNTDYKADGWAALCWVAIINVPLAFFASVFAVRLLGWKEFKVVSKIKGWGDPLLVSAEIENQYTGQCSLTGKTWAITPDYVVENALFQFQVHRLSDLVWVYKQVTRKRADFIPIGKDYDARLEFIRGTVKLSGKEKVVDRAVEILSQNHPWIFSGYHDGLQELLLKSRQDVIDELNARKTQAKKQK